MRQWQWSTAMMAPLQDDLDRRNALKGYAIVPCECPTDLCQEQQSSELGPPCSGREGTSTSDEPRNLHTRLVEGLSHLIVRHASAQVAGRQRLDYRGSIGLVALAIHDGQAPEHAGAAGEGAHMLVHRDSSYCAGRGVADLAGCAGASEAISASLNGTTRRISP